MEKAPEQQAQNTPGLRYITALTDPQVRKLLGEGELRMSLFAETVAEVEDKGRRYGLRKNQAEAAGAVWRPPLTHLRVALLGSLGARLAEGLRGKHSAVLVEV